MQFVDHFTSSLLTAHFYHLISKSLIYFSSISVILFVFNMIITLIYICILF
ncbi:hypothetical protein PROSTU_04195 [Providencia stuartii ATCC 25827]|uniref:Uncharacterized protein n=1 Tax=Providencia stuartii ATCC 25827 TaxID=471874 RepID=A0AA86YPK3_PROST|nr:hypothetical protein PROSTU_04195 [Providencia stuartii ATCC 25827]